MKQLNALQNFMVRVFRIERFDVNQALRTKFQQGKERGLAEGRLEKADCKTCALYQADQRRLHGLRDQQGPTTEGKIAAEQMKRRGYVEQIRTQHNLPKLPPRLPRKYSLSRYSGLYPDETEHSIPAFLRK